jgi:hypothetical protein
LEKLSVAAARENVPWYWVSGRERFTKATLPASLSVSTSGLYFPLPKHKGLIPQFPPVRGANLGQALGYKRGSGARTHAGVDLMGSRREAWEVLAIADGEIVNFYWFINGTFALIVNHGSFVINYGEIRRDSLKRLGLKTPRFTDGDVNRSTKRRLTTSSSSYPDFVAASGSEIKAGQQIGWLAHHPSRNSMLHLEAYSSGTTNQGWSGFPNASPPSRLRNPTNLLITLKGTKQPTKEVLLPPIHLGT